MGRPGKIPPAGSSLVSNSHQKKKKERKENECLNPALTSQQASIPDLRQRHRRPVTVSLEAPCLVIESHCG